MANSSAKSNNPWLSIQPFQVIGEPLGSGAFGKVWKVKHTVDTNYYAIKRVSIVKTLRHNDGNFTKLIREVRNLEKISNKYVVKYHNCWLEGPLSSTLEMGSPQDKIVEDIVEEYSSTQDDVNFLFIQMELCDSTLKSWLKDPNHSSVESRCVEAVQILNELAKGLKAIHDRDIIHRDLKPDNIFLKNMNDQHNSTVSDVKCQFIIKIGDFGLSKDVLKDEDEAFKSFVGCLHYKSPEVEKHSEYGKKSDVFSLGLIFLEVLFPFETDTQKRECFSDLRDGRKNPNNSLNKLISKDYFNVEGNVLKKMLICDENRRIDSEGMMKMLQGQSYSQLVCKVKPAKTVTPKQSAKQPKSKFNNSSTTDKNIIRPIRFQIRPPISTFTGRNRELQMICGLFKQRKTNQLKNIVVLEGLGGIGKTNLARKFAEVFYNECKGDVIWILAENADTLAMSWKELIETRLKITANSESFKDVLKSFYNIFQTYCQSPQTEPENSKTQSGSKTVSSPVKLHLLRLPPPPTLIILDNAEILKADKNSNAPEVFDYLPHCHDFCTEDYQIPYFLITTRKHDFFPNSQRLKVSPLLLEEAMEFVRNVLTDIIDIKASSFEADNEALCHSLQNFPLALQQAVAFIRENHGMGYTIKTYVDDFQTRKAKLLLGHEFADSTDDSYELTTLITWDISLEKIKSVQTYGQMSMEIMHIIAFLPAENIPTNFIKAVLAPEDETFSTEDDLNDAVLDNVFTLPQKYSMYILHQRKISVHRLVQKVIQIKLAESKNMEDVTVLRRIMKGCFKLFSLAEKMNADHLTSIDNDPERFFFSVTNVCEELFKNFYPCILTAWKKAQNHKCLLQEFYKFPFILINLTADPLDLYKKSNHKVLLETVESILSVFKDDLLTCLKLIHSCKRILQQPFKYCPLIKIPISEKNNVWRLIHEFECRNLGHDDPETVMSLETYARAITQHDLSNVNIPEVNTEIQQGVQLYENEYHRRKEVYGPDHESTMEIFKELAEATVHLNFENGLAMYKQLLSQQRKIFGINDDRTVDTLKALARLYHALQFYDIDDIEKKNFYLELVPFYYSLFEIEKKRAEKMVHLNFDETAHLEGFSYGILLSEMLAHKLEIFDKAVEVLDAIVKTQDFLLRKFPHLQYNSNSRNIVIRSLTTRRIYLFHEELMKSFGKCAKCRKVQIKCQHESENPKVRQIIKKLQI